MHEIEHELLDRLTNAKLRHLDELVGETIIEVGNFDSTYLVFESGQWALIDGAVDELMSTKTEISECAATENDIPTLHYMGLVSADEFTSWQNATIAFAARLKEAIRLQRIEHMKLLMAEFTDVAENWLKDTTNRITITSEQL